MFHPTPIPCIGFSFNPLFLPRSCFDPLPSPSIFFTGLSFYSSPCPVSSSFTLISFNSIILFFTLSCFIRLQFSFIFFQFYSYVPSHVLFISPPFQFLPIPCFQYLVSSLCPFFLNCFNTILLFIPMFCFISLHFFSKLFQFHPSIHPHVLYHTSSLLFGNYA